MVRASISLVFCATLATGALCAQSPQPKPAPPGRNDTPVKTVTAVNTMKNPLAFGAAAELNVVVEPQIGSTTPKGTVILREGKKALSSTELRSGEATMELQGLTPGKHLLTVKYSGDGKHAASTSKPVGQVVEIVRPGRGPDLRR